LDGFWGRETFKSIGSTVFSLDGRKLAISSVHGAIQIIGVATRQYASLTDIESEFGDTSNLLGIDAAGFLCSAGKRVVWLPFINRGTEKMARHRDTIVVGASSGSVTFVKYSR
jgi:hypothetical protein